MNAYLAKPVKHDLKRRGQSRANKSARGRGRLLARLRAGKLDRALAAGASPDSSPRAGPSRRDVEQPTDAKHAGPGGGAADRAIGPASAGPPRFAQPRTPRRGAGRARRARPAPSSRPADGRSRRRARPGVAERWRWPPVLGPKPRRPENHGSNGDRRARAEPRPITSKGDPMNGLMTVYLARVLNDDFRRQAAANSARNRSRGDRVARAPRSESRRAARSRSGSIALLRLGRRARA